MLKTKKRPFVYCMILIISLYASTLYNSQALRKLQKILYRIYFVSFWDKNSHTTISSNLHAWLFNAVRFSSLTKVQRERYFSLDEMEEESYSPIDDFYDEEELLQKRNQLLTELKKLPEQEYNVLVKIVLEDKKYKEVAEELHISVNTVKTHLSRALKMLRRFNMIEILILFNL